MNVLLTGFEAFGGERINPSQEAVRLVRHIPKGTELHRLYLPVVFGEAGKILTEAMEREKPDIVICTGQAGGRSGITAERIAVNLADAEIPDNAGKKPQEEVLEPDGASAYFSTLPVKRLAEAVCAAGIPAAVSNSAGLYVCNSVLYAALHQARTMHPQPKAVFIHLPYLPEQVTNTQTASLSLEEDVRALETVLEAAVEAVREAARGESYDQKETEDR